MDIYKIHVEHFSQKDSHESIECFLLADSDEEVYKWVDKKVHGSYTDKSNEDGMCDIYDEEFNVIGQETYKEKMIRVGGEFFDEDFEPTDLYYGCTIYGWEKLEVKFCEVTINQLKAIGRLIDCSYENS